MQTLFGFRVQASWAVPALIAATSVFTTPPAVSGESSCQPADFEGAQYTICSFDPKQADLRLFWKDDQNNPYRTFAAVAAEIEEQGSVLRFAVNAGMYDPNFRPVGLYVEGGRELRAINTGDAEKRSGPVPNFYKKPNGVFYLTEGAAGVLTTDEYIRQKPVASFATQSGPMLVIDGQIHPSFIVGSRDRTKRSGVGVCERGMVRVAVSETSVNFDEFARLFRDRLDCENALFLDGGRGVGMYDPDVGRADFSWHGGFGPMLGVVEQAP